MYNDMDSYKRYCFSEQQSSMISVSKGEGCIGQTVTILQRFLFYSSNYLMAEKLTCNHITSVAMHFQWGPKYILSKQSKTFLQRLNTHWKKGV